MPPVLSLSDTLPDTIFAISNSLALVGWIALILTPGLTRRSAWARHLAGRLLPGLFAIVYIGLLAVYWRGEGGFGSLAAVSALFEVPGVLTAGWLHYLAFDLFVGAWIADRAARLGISWWWIAPILVLTFLLGPVGWLAYLVLHSLHRRDHTLQPGELS